MEWNGLNITKFGRNMFSCNLSCLFLALQHNVGQGRLVPEVSKSHAMTHHSPQDSSGRRIGLSQRPLPDNIQLSQERSMPPAGFEPAIPASERPYTVVLDRSATGIEFELLQVPIHSRTDGN